MAESLHRHFVQKPWGRTDIPDAFGKVEGKLGEVWFDRPKNPLPILVKWLFTSEKLSVQVHPSDEEARARGLASGKEECWIVTEAEKDARLGIGFKKSLTREELRSAVASGEIEELLDWKPVKPGDWYFIPAGTVHAIGAGVRLVEVQQNADITYRLYDYGRPRELHLDDGIEVSDPRPYDGQHGKVKLDHDFQRLVQCKYFTIDYVTQLDVAALSADQVLVVPLSGFLTAGEERITVGSVWVGALGDCQSDRQQFSALVVRPKQSGCL